MHQLRVGDRVRLSGGYDFEPQWLNRMEAITGTVAAFIPGQNKDPATVVALDQTLHSHKGSGDTAVLELRNKGASWIEEGTVHVELCDFEPEARTWRERKQGLWVESHATYHRID